MHHPPEGKQTSSHSDGPIGNSVSRRSTACSTDGCIRRNSLLDSSLTAAPPALDWPSNVVLTGFPLWDEGSLRNPSPGLAEFLAAGPPPIVFTAGSAMVQAGRFFQVSAEVYRTSGLRALFLTQGPRQLPIPLPGGSCHYHYVPLTKLGFSRGMK
jgi:hypothetical protein